MNKIMTIIRQREAARRAVARARAPGGRERAAARRSLEAPRVQDRRRVLRLADPPDPARDRRAGLREDVVHAAVT